MLYKLVERKKILLLLSIICLSLSFIQIIRTPQVSGFERSLYSGFPTSFWIFLISAFLLSSLFILLSSFQLPKKRYLGLSFVVLFLAFLVFFLLPYIRGYALLGRGAADILNHVGYTKTILETNHIGPENWYPVSHILMAQFRMLGLSFEVGRALISFAFTLIYIIFTVLYINELEKKLNGLAVLFCVLPLIYTNFHVSFHPALMSFFTIPLLLYLYEKSKNIEGKYEIKTLVFLGSIFIVFFHPVTTVILILIFSVQYISEITPIYHEYKKQASKYLDQTKTFCIEIILILFAFFYGWYLQFTRTEEAIRTRMYGLFFREEQEAMAGEYASRVAESELPLFHRFFEAFDRVGLIIIYGSIAILIVIVFVNNYLSKNQKSHSEFSISLQYAAGLLFGFISLTHVITGSHIGRAGRYAILFATIIIGYYLSKIIKNLKSFNRKKIEPQKFIVLAVLIILISSVFVFSIYSVYDTNNHLTYSEERGTDWYVDNANYLDKEGIESLMTYKMVRYLRGTHNHPSEERGNIFGDRNGNLEWKHPHRLGYLENETAAETFNDSVYLITKPYDWTYHDDWHPIALEDANYYLEEDLEKLEKDLTVNKLYTNEEFTVWHVKEN